jgi:hypothetical protein
MIRLAVPRLVFRVAQSRGNDGKTMGDMTIPAKIVDE